MDCRERLQHGVRHPWEVIRAQFFVELLTRAGVTGNVLDVGAGDAYFAGRLAPHVSRITAFDPRYTNESAPTGVTCTAALPSGVFHAVILLDVLEHVADDLAVLREAVDRLTPGGFALVSVPAFPSLFTAHDVALGHHRRYRLADLRAIIRRAGLSLVLSGWLYPSLLPVRVAQKLIEVGRGVRSRPTVGIRNGEAETETGAWSHGPVVTTLVTRALRLDTRLTFAIARTGVALPGLSAWALASRVGTTGGNSRALRPQGYSCAGPR